MLIVSSFFPRHHPPHLRISPNNTSSEPPPTPSAMPENREQLTRLTAPVPRAHARLDFSGRVIPEEHPAWRAIGIAQQSGKPREGRKEGRKERARKPGLSSPSLRDNVQAVAPLWCKFFPNLPRARRASWRWNTGRFQDGLTWNLNSSQIDGPFLDGRGKIHESRALLITTRVRLARDMFSVSSREDIGANSSDIR